jgi:quercetin dioxygenase-like cupin family protein
MTINESFHSALHAVPACLLMRVGVMMRWLALGLMPGVLFAQTTTVHHPDELQQIAISPGVLLKELTGRTAPDSARSDKVSVAYFHLEPGCASAWSYNKVGEESFFVLKGHGEIRTGKQTQALRPGSYIVIQPSIVRSIKASADEALEFYAITSPAWSSDDDVLISSHEGMAK